MARRTLTKWLLGAALTLGVTALGTSTAQAHLFGHHHGSCGSSGGWYGGSCGSWGSCGSSGGSWGSSGGSWGSYGCCGSSGGSWGSYGCCGSSGGSCGSSGGSWGSSGCCGSSGGSYSEGYSYPSPGVPMEAPTTAPPGPNMPTAPVTPPPPGKNAFDVSPDVGYLIVDVPADAKVFVNGHATTSTGEHRQYVSHGLEAGMRYEYQVRVEIVRDGKPVSETKTVQLSAGSQADVAFDISGKSPVPQTAKTGAAPRTAVLLHVPADAKVYLSGVEMNSTGPDREFVTTKLAGEIPPGSASPSARCEQRRNPRANVDVEGRRQPRVDVQLRQREGCFGEPLIGRCRNLVWNYETPTPPRDPSRGGVFSFLSPQR